MTLDQYLKIVANGHIYRHIYHFTDNANMPSIAKFGLLSKDQAKQMGITVEAPGGNDWSRDADMLRELYDYVNLCFTRDHPMCYVAHKNGNILNPKYLAIDPEIFRLDGVKITLDVANKPTTEILDVVEGLEGIDTEVLYTRTDWRDPTIKDRLQRARKCEILVPKTVPVCYIKEIYN